MIAFAYRGGDQEEGAGDIKESFRKSNRQAPAASLGPQIQGFASLTTDSRHDITRGEFRFVRVDGLEFNPSERLYSSGSRRFTRRSLGSAPRKNSMETSFGVGWRSISASF